jgi:hypothetical protein
MKTESSMPGSSIYANLSVNDEKYTPKYAVLPILKYLPRKTVWCPFDTQNSEFVLALQENGFDVVYSHIGTGQDFFTYEPARWDIIVSNPPFTCKKRVFERCLQFGKPFALLMSNLWLNDSAPHKLFKNMNLQLLFFDKRIHFDDKTRRIPFASSYFCRNLLPKQIIFEDLEYVKGRVSRMYSDFKDLNEKEE